MRTLTRSAVLLTLLLGAPGLLAQAPKTERFLLTVDSIMRGPDLVGYPPENLRWSADSQKLYFEWRRAGEDEASTYAAGRDGGEPVKLTDEQKTNVPAANARWDKAHTRALFATRGDIVLLDAAGARRQITKTTAV